MASLVIVALAAAIMLRRRLRPRGLRIGQDSGCAGCAGGLAGARGTVVFRARKGERPQIIYRAR